MRVSLLYKEKNTALLRIYSINKR